MLFFKKKTPKAPVDLGWLHTDMHSHLIPGIDDGAPDLATSLELIRGLMSLGYKKIITTPHILSDLYPNRPETILNGLSELQSAVQAEGLDIELGAAAEYFLDEQFTEQLRQKTPLLTLSGNMVLVEFSMLTAPFDLQDVLFEMQMQGYQPVLAHPERYAYLNRRRSFFETLKDAGCLFQLNLLSLTGYYGEEVQSLAAYLMDMDYYNFAGTDLHHARHLEMMQRLSSSHLYEELKTLPLMNRQLSEPGLGRI